MQETRYYLDKGYKIDIYDIGNEIEWGILNFRPNERINLKDLDVVNNMDFMVNNVWNIESVLLKSAIEGVKSADPNAEIALHIASLGISKDNIFLKTFYNTMINNNVDFDYIGLSYPYGNQNVVDNTRPYFRSKEFMETLVYLNSLNKKVIFSEFSYPNSSVGIDSEADIGYQYDSQGQANWVKDFLSACGSSNVNGAFYFYPEYFPGISYGSSTGLESSGLFKNANNIQPGLSIFKYFKER